MKKNKNIYLIAALLISVAIVGIILVLKGNGSLNTLSFVVLGLIIVTGVIALFNALKKGKERKEGQPDEDELSNLIKYKASHYAFTASMYMWLFIFIFKDKFPDIETMLGGGILLSALILFISRIVVKREMNE